MVYLAAAALAMAGAAHAATIEHWWNITYATANPDGVSLAVMVGMGNMLTK
jgi:iron transport multicopper oxidase